MRKRFKSSKQASLVLGYRSGLEEKINEQLISSGANYKYEPEKIKYVQPATPRTYTPDFVLYKSTRNPIYIETKGRLMSADRKKHIWIKDQHPELDIRFLFQNSNTKISKGSKTTYADWCIKNGFLYADKEIPEEWLME